MEAVTKRKPYFVELLAFLALHPEGVTGSAVADAFSISGSRARTDVGHVRKWLGTNPRTGRLHLPAADASHAYEETGVKTYQALPTICVKAWLGSSGSLGSVVADVRSTDSTNGRVSITLAVAKSSFGGGGTCSTLSTRLAGPGNGLPAWM